MPKIQWSGLPEALRTHLLLRLKERQVTEQDLLKLMEWRQSEPNAPEGLWYKDVDEMSRETSTAGIYAAGDLVMRPQQAMLAAASGNLAAAKLNHALTAELATSGGLP